MVKQSSSLQHGDNIGQRPSAIVIQHTAAEELEAFDSLPAEIRKVLTNTNARFSSVEIKEFYQMNLDFHGEYAKNAIIKALIQRVNDIENREYKDYWTRMNRMALKKTPFEEEISLEDRLNIKDYL